MTRRNLHQFARTLACYIALAVGLLSTATLALAQTPGTWTTTGNVHFQRGCQTATLLNNGLVLVAGGAQSASAELYDPATATWSVTGSLVTNRACHQATLLPSGEVLVAGGRDLMTGQTLFASAELYNPSTGKWTKTGSMTVPRALFGMVLLGNGEVLAAGGDNSQL